MNNYIQIEFQDISIEQSERLIAELNEIGFEGFEETKKKLSAFISSETYNESRVKEIADKLSLGFNKSIIEETNWNEVWETNFESVMVDDFVAIRADFHKPVIGVEHEIIITPKMSFGTGHHATTYMMIQQMQEIDFTNKTVFDFGTGTGVLAILAEKLGAVKIIAVDNDEWSITNAAENIQKNNCNKIQLIKTDNADMDEQVDIILANINKNTILDNFSSLAKQLSLNGSLLISGLLKEDEEQILQAAEQHHIRAIKKLIQNNWLSIRFEH
jgi:ribosomal protein L11 methyltransferase